MPIGPEDLARDTIDQWKHQGRDSWKPGRRRMKKAKTKVKTKAPKRRLREDLKDPAFRARYEEELRTQKLAIKLATEHISKPDR